MDRFDSHSWAVLDKSGKSINLSNYCPVNKFIVGQEKYVRKHISDTLYKNTNNNRDMVNLISEYVADGYVWLVLDFHNRRLIGLYDHNITLKHDENDIIIMTKIRPSLKIIDNIGFHGINIILEFIDENTNEKVFINGWVYGFGIYGLPFISGVPVVNHIEIISITYDVAQNILDEMKNKYNFVKCSLNKLDNKELYFNLNRSIL